MLYINNISSYGDITTGKWFQRFVVNHPGCFPIALDVFADGWNVSKQHSSVGVYFTISNLPKDENWKTIHKFPVCLIPPEVDTHKAITSILQEVKFKALPFQLTIAKTPKLAKIQIARVICDTPGVSEICNVKNHSAGCKLQNMFICCLINYLILDSCCRICHIKKKDLFSLDPCKFKSQQELVDIWNKYSPDLG